MKDLVLRITVDDSLDIDDIMELKERILIKNRIPDVGDHGVTARGFEDEYFLKKTIAKREGKDE